MLAHPVVAQNRLGPEAPPHREPIPLIEPCPQQGAERENQWQTTREGADREPTAAFLKSLQGSDSTIDVVLGQARLLTTRKPIANEDGVAVIAVGDPTILDFEVLSNPRTIRLIGRRPGVTDLSITTADDQTHIFEVHTVYDLALLNTQLQKVYPDTEVQLTQIRGYLILEGQARNIAQIAAIEKTLLGYLSAVSNGAGRGPTAAPAPRPAPAQAGDQQPPPPDVNVTDDSLYAGRAGLPRADVEEGLRGNGGGGVATPRIINLMRVPGVHQVMLQVRVGELSRTSLREIGTDWFVEWGRVNRIGTQMAGAQQTLNGIAGLGASSRAFGIFPSGNVEICFARCGRTRF